MKRLGTKQVRSLGALVLGVLLCGHTPTTLGGGATLYGSDRDSNLFTLDVTTGMGMFVGGPISNPPFGVTEIEYDNIGMTAFAQHPDGFFEGNFFDINTGVPTSGPIVNGGAYTGLEYVDDTLYGTVIFGPGFPSELHTLDPAIGTHTFIGLTGVGPISGIAYDVGAGIMYGIAGGPGPATLYTINLTTGQATVVGTTGLQAGSLQFGPDGNLYAGGTGPNFGELHRIDPANGASTFVGDTGFGPVTGLTLLGVVTPTADRTLVIKQGACPAPVRPDSNGFTPMLLVGDVDFDVSDVLLSSLELIRCDGVGGAVAPHSGPPGPGIQIVDLNHPNDDDVGCEDEQVPCACNEDQSSDGIDDLKLKFRTSDMTDAFMLDQESAGTEITLFLTGMLEDGTEFTAADCIRIVGPPAPTGLLAVGSTLPEVWIDTTPLDNILDGGGFTSFERSYPQGTYVTLTAPAIHNGWVFTGWLVNGEEYPWPVSTIVVNVEGGITTAFTRYRQPCDINGDGSVNVLDLIDLLLCFGQPALPGCVAEDVNADGTVNVLDLIELLLAFGTACP